jgi:hypothetical protein
MESKSKMFEPLLQDIEELLKTSFSIGKLKTVKQISTLGANVVYFLILSLLIGLVFLFLATACSFFLGQLLGSNTLGFLMVAGFFMFLILVLVLSKNKLFAVLHQKIIHALLS